MNVLITAGGTSERIDSVRSISNISTGRLGSLIADSFDGSPDINEIFYICNKGALLPKSNKVKINCVDNVESLERTISNISIQTTIDVIIHSMAVSDYRVKSVTSASSLARMIIAQKEELDKASKQMAETIITSLFHKSAPIFDDSGKIGSDIGDMVLLMEKTPKVISLFQKTSPHSILVGFKLLDSAPHETLINTAYRLLQTNRCDFVLANDLSEIDGDNHIGCLIDTDCNYQRFTTKQEIAAGIVTAVMTKRRSL